MSIESDAYNKHRNLRIAAKDLGIPIPTLYSRLKRQGVSVVGDKLTYGCKKDQLAARAEILFSEIIDSAISMNESKFQSKFDFVVNGYKVDVKASNKNLQNAGKTGTRRWSFLFSKQTYDCDFMCCFCLGDDGESIEKMLIIPSEFFRGIQTVSVPCSGVGKWCDFCVTPEEAREFFYALPAGDFCVEDKKIIGVLPAASS